MSANIKLVHVKAGQSGDRWTQYVWPEHWRIDGVSAGAGGAYANFIVLLDERQAHAVYEALRALP